jgi:uncharacterized repeat protein (TIGR03803 family)
VFKLTPPVAPQTQWTESVIYNFLGGADGYGPTAGLVFDTSGALYGTTDNGGGTRCLQGCGTVFKLTPPVAPATQWTESILYSFNSAGDGDTPIAGVIFDTSGALYGTTMEGGAAGGGTVFKLTPPVAPATQWTESILHNFGVIPNDGLTPYAGVVSDTSGALFGVTNLGGVAGYGVIYKLAAPNAAPSHLAGARTESVLYSFTGGADGGSPDASLLFAGALFGVTYRGGVGQSGGTGDGVLFALTCPPEPGIFGGTLQLSCAP